MISSTETKVYTSWAELKTKSSRMTTCMKTSNTQKPLKPAEENKDADEDTDSEDEGIEKRTRSNRATVGALHVYKPMIAPPDMRYKISIINTA